MRDPKPKIMISLANSRWKIDRVLLKLFPFVLPSNLVLLINLWSPSITKRKSKGERGHSIIIVLERRKQEFHAIRVGLLCSSLLSIKMCNLKKWDFCNKGQGPLFITHHPSLNCTSLLAWRSWHLILKEIFIYKTMA